ncbi:hypothetical protein N7450_000900 [Penicillium hetheringtonii]|uniref:Xylanolytic transcriptional activator regulatory domain-containing protein n=1 Tax=Penicillium hetheringtonii TaxID=911720 RepID=A0AAD6E4D4_9EURO|nr:hypothetical protein N7450_000900 [Penicillium hetheringtonii]
MHHAEDEDRDNFVLEKIPPELYFMMIHGANRMEMEGLQWADHLSSQTIERMSLAIMSDTVHGQIALHYKLCILSKATVYASRWLRVCPSEHMSDYLDRSRKQYAAAALECLRKIDFSRSPSISMLQALLAGGAVVQLHGDTTRSWFLISLASRALVALGYHKMTNFNIASNEANEIRRCIYYCYYMDKTSSMLLVRPSSLPDLPFNPADLVHIDINQPISVHVKMLVKLARVQDVALSLMLNPSQQTLPAKDHVLKDIHAELISIGNEIHQLRGQPNAHEPSVLIEWDTVDFTFFSIATTVLRLDSDSLQDITRREECLKYARKALHSMQACQKYIPVKSSITPDYLFWYDPGSTSTVRICIKQKTHRTVLFYPLTPFFVIFCNVVATSNLHDLKLLEEVTVTISRLKEQCTIGKNLHKLLSELIGLCAELHEMPPDRYPRLICNPDGNQAQVHTVPGRDPLGANTDISGQTALPTPGQDDMVPAGVSTFAPGGSNYQENEESARKRVSIWDDGLMTELFNVQPSVEWLDIECVDMIHGFQS